MCQLELTVLPLVNFDLSVASETQHHAYRKLDLEPLFRKIQEYVTVSVIFRPSSCKFPL